MVDNFPLVAWLGWLGFVSVGRCIGACAVFTGSRSLGKMRGPCEKIGQRAASVSDTDLDALDSRALGV
jgi:hypothetical protein